MIDELTNQYLEPMALITEKKTYYLSRLETVDKLLVLNFLGDEDATEN